VLGAAIAPDGKYVAYILAENEGKSLWVRQVGTASNIRVLPPSKSEFWGVTFSPDGAYLYYNVFAGDKPDLDLFRVASLGGRRRRFQSLARPRSAISRRSRIAYTTSYSAGERLIFQYPTPTAAMIATSLSANSHPISRSWGR